MGAVLAQRVGGGELQEVWLLNTALGVGRVLVVNHNATYRTVFRNQPVAGNHAALEGGIVGKKHLSHNHLPSVLRPSPLRRTRKAGVLAGAAAHFLQVVPVISARHTHQRALPLSAYIRRARIPETSTVETLPGHARLTGGTVNHNRNRHRLPSLGTAAGAKAELHASHGLLLRRRLTLRHAHGSRVSLPRTAGTNLAVGEINAAPSTGGHRLNGTLTHTLLHRASHAQARRKLTQGITTEHQAAGAAHQVIENGIVTLGTSVTVFHNRNLTARKNAGSVIGNLAAGTEKNDNGIIAGARSERHITARVSNVVASAHGKRVNRILTEVNLAVTAVRALAAAPHLLPETRSER